MKLTKILENSLTDPSISEEQSMFVWQISPNMIKEAESVFVAPNKDREDIKSKLETALNTVAADYNKIMAMFYYFDDKSLGTISEKVLASLLEKTGVFKQGTVAQTGGSGGLSDLEIAGQGISLKTTQISSAIGLGSAEGEGGIDQKDKTLPNLTLGKQLGTTRIKISELPTKFKTKGQSVYDAVDRKVKNISIKLGNDLFLWAGISRDKKTKRLSGFTFYLLDLNGKKVYNQIMKKGYLQLQSSGKGSVGKSWNVLDSDGSIFTMGDTGSKYLNVYPSWVLKTFNAAQNKLQSEAKSNVKTKDMETDIVQGSKISIKVDPTLSKPTKFSFDDTSKQVFNAMLSVLTEPKNMQKIVSAIPI